MIIASRTLRIVQSGTSTPVVVEISVPVPDDRAWKCSYQISWPDGPKTSAGYGSDSVQAINLTMQKVAIELYTSSYHRAGTLQFEKPGAGYGFPIGKEFRHLLVGDDKTFDGD